MLTVNDRARVKAAFREFLVYARERAISCDLRPGMRPGWLDSAEVRIGVRGNSYLGCFDFSAVGDLMSLREVGSDVPVLLDGPDFPGTPPMLPSALGRKEGVVVLRGTYGPGLRGDREVDNPDEGGTAFKINGRFPNLALKEENAYHSPFMLSDIAFEHAPTEDAVIRRLVPLALYLHRDDTETIPTKVRDLMRSHGELDELFGDYKRLEGFYSEIHAGFDELSRLHERTVIVLGSYAKDEITDLITVRDGLRSMTTGSDSGARRLYRADLISDLPDIPGKTNEGKVRLWTGAARFNVMVDRTPSGAAAEYVMLRESRSIIALLRPSTGGSTSMIGNDSLVDVNFIKVFEFTSSPLQVLAEASQWAESVYQARVRAYENMYG